MNAKRIFVAVLTGVSLSAIAQQSADTKSFETSLPPKLTAPTVKGEPLPGPKVVTSETCQRAPEICEARKEELRRKRQACHDDPSSCKDPALAQREP